MYFREIVQYLITSFLLYRYYIKKCLKEKITSLISKKNLFGWSSRSQVPSPSIENCNFDLNEDLDILGDNEECDEELQGGESSTQKKRNLKVRTDFHEQWKNKYKWLREANNEGKIVMKCIVKHIRKLYHGELELVPLP